MSNVELIIEAKAKDLGDNFMVRRSLPQAKKRLVGPFIFWDHMGPVILNETKDMVVRAHPHIGLATITYLFSGEIMHRDSLGNEQPIRPGEVNWMTAGNGIVHSERAKSENGDMELEGIQLWLALPKESEDIDANFFHIKENELPLINHCDVSLRLIAGSILDHQSPVPVYSSLFYAVGEVSEDGFFNYPLSANEEAAIYVIEGIIDVEGQEYEKFTMVTFKKGTSVDLKAVGNAKFMLLGGDAFPEKRYIWWNFVSTDQEKIEEAKRKWTNDEFPAVINETQRIPLPKD